MAYLYGPPVMVVIFGIISWIAGVLWVVLTIMCILRRCRVTFSRFLSFTTKSRILKRFVKQAASCRLFELLAKQA